MTTLSRKTLRLTTGRMDASGSRERVPVVVNIAIVIAILVDVLTHVSLGPLSVSGFVTLGLAGGFIAASPMLIGYRRALPTSLIVFVGYVTIRLLHEPASDGLQMVCVWVLFVVGGMFAARGNNSERAGRSLLLFTRTALVLCGVFFTQLIMGTVIYVTRGFALTALVLLAAAISIPSRRLWVKLAPFVIAFAIVISLSRTASAISILMLIGLAIRQQRGRRLPLVMGGLLIMGTVGYLLITAYPPFRDRFLGGDNAVEFGGLSLNTSGRSNIWDALSQSASSAPWFGHGPGSSVELVTKLYAPITQPHNEYLRILHDLGIVGMILFAIGMLALLCAIVRRAVTEDASVHWAALLATVAVLLAATTDNVFVYPFVMLPLGVLVGLSLGLPPPPQPSRRRLQHESARALSANVDSLV